MATDYFNGPTRTDKTDRNVHSQVNDEMSVHMPHVHERETRRAERNTEAMRERADAAASSQQHDESRQAAAQESAAPTRADLDAHSTTQEATQARAPTRADLDAASSFGEAGKQVTGRAALDENTVAQQQAAPIVQPEPTGYER